MMPTNDLITGLREWAKNQHIEVRAATNLLIDHGKWLCDAEFLTRCVLVDEGVPWIDWSYVDVERLLDRGHPASPSEKALLRVAVLIARDTLDLSSLDRTNRELTANAFADGLGVAMSAAVAQRAEDYAAARADQAPAGMYVHVGTFVAAVIDGDVDRSRFRGLYNELLHATHGSRAFATNTKPPAELGEAFSAVTP